MQALDDLRRLLEIADGEWHECPKFTTAGGDYIAAIDLGLLGSATWSADVSNNAPGKLANDIRARIQTTRTPAGDALLAALVDAERYRALRQRCLRPADCGACDSDGELTGSGMDAYADALVAELAEQEVCNAPH